MFSLTIQANLNRPLLARDFLMITTASGGIHLMGRDGAYLGRIVGASIIPH